MSAFNGHFKGKAKTTTSDHLTEIIALFIESKNKSGGQSKSWNQKYSNLKLKLEYFEQDNNTRIKFSDIDQDWVDQYCGYLRQLERKPFKPLNDNSLHRNINFLFTFLYWAEGKYHNVDLSKVVNPVKAYQPDDVHITFDEIKILETMPLSEALERTRDLFLIGAYSGQRFSDYSVFEKADVKGEMIIKRAEKTEDESFIPLHPKLKSLLDKYNWNLPRISEQRFNDNIKKICQKAEINDRVKEVVYRGNDKQVVYHEKWQMVSSHTARRTFITLSAEQGMADHIIMKITGIKDPKTLLKYKKTSQRSVIEAMNKYWG